MAVFFFARPRKLCNLTDDACTMAMGHNSKPMFPKFLHLNDASLRPAQGHEGEIMGEKRGISTEDLLLLQPCQQNL